MRKLPEVSEQEIAAFKKQLADPANRIVLSDEAFERVTALVEENPISENSKLKELLSRPGRFDVV